MNAYHLPDSWHWKHLIKLPGLPELGIMNLVPLTTAWRLRNENKASLQSSSWEVSEAGFHPWSAQPRAHGFPKIVPALLATSLSSLKLPGACQRAGILRGRGNEANLQHEPSGNPLNCTPEGTLDSRSV